MWLLEKMSIRTRVRRTADVACDEVIDPFADPVISAMDQRLVADLPMWGPDLAEARRACQQAKRPASAP